LPTLKTKSKALNSTESLYFRDSDSNGVTLVELLISLGILSLLALIASQAWKSAFEILGGINFNTDRVEVGMTLRSEMDCAKTVAAMGSSCDNKSKGSPAQVSLRDSSNQILLPQQSKKIDVAPKYDGYGTCYDEDGLWNFTGSITQRSTSEASNTRTTNNVLGKLPYKCLKGASRCTTTLPGEINTGKLWVVKIGPGTPSNSGWCSGDGILKLPTDATNIQAMLVVAFADDWGARFKINNKIVWNEPKPYPWFGGGQDYNPNLDISSFFVKGENTITARGYDTQGGYCGAGLSVNISYDTNEGCNLNYQSNCTGWGLHCDPETYPDGTELKCVNNTVDIFTCKPTRGGPEYLFLDGFQGDKFSQCKNPIPICKKQEVPI
jgi:prepilin-type N-terminal cleavage/methylation domain-containing protein